MFFPPIKEPFVKIESLHFWRRVLSESEIANWNVESCDCEYCNYSRLTPHAADPSQSISKEDNEALENMPLDPNEGG